MLEKNIYTWPLSSWMVKDLFKGDDSCDVGALKKQVANLLSIFHDKCPV